MAACRNVRASLARLLKIWGGSLRFRLLALGVMPLLLAFPIIIAVLLLIGGQRTNALLGTQLHGNVAGARNYLDTIKAEAQARISDLVRSDRLTALIENRASMAEMNQALSIAVRGSGLDYLLLVVAEDGTVLGSSTGVAPGQRLPDSPVIRQARIGITSAAFERFDERQLEAFSPRFPQQARVESLPPSARTPLPEPIVETHGLLINAAAHFPLSVEVPETLLVGGILLNNNAALIEHMREIIYPVGALPDNVEGITAIYLDGVSIAVSRQRLQGLRPGDLRIPVPILADAGNPQSVWLDRHKLAGVEHAIGYAPLLDSDGQRAGTVGAGFPDEPYQRTTWWLLGMISLLLGATMLAISVVFLRVGNQIARRLAQLTDTMSAVRQGDREARVDLRQTHDEIDLLAQHFNDLLNTIAAQETEQRAGQQAIADEAARRRALFESERDGVVILDADGRVFEANASCIAMLDYDLAAFRALHVPDWDVGFSRDELVGLLKSLGPEGRFYETTHRRRDGGQYLAEVSISRVEWGGKTFALMLMRDITERKQAENQLRLSDERHRLLAEELRQARDVAERASMAKSEFLAHMSHEIRTPLNAVLGLAQVLNREPLRADQRDMVERIQTAGRSLLAIINDILDLSKIEAGELRLEPRPFDLAGVVTQLQSLMGETASTKGLILDVAGLAEPLGPLVGDILRLEQVLVNLVGNAIKFTERGEVTLQVQICETGATWARLRFEVRDTGIGIAPEALARLFTPFTQAEAGITRRFGGTGLGLAICKRLVELMGGAIGVESQVGQGSLFWFELLFPRAAAGDPVSSLLSAPRRPAGPRLAGMRVLVVDDSAMNRDVAERALSVEGATVTLAADGQQAIQHLRARPDAFDAVLMDVQMPVMDGLTATRLIRGELGLTELPIIAFTAGVLAEQQRVARAAGANDVLPKPLDLEQMVAILLQWLPAPLPVVSKADPLTPTLTPMNGGEGIERLRDGELPDDFPAVPGIDRVRAARTLGHNRAFFLRLLAGFVTEFAEVVAQTHRDLADGEREAAARRLHTLRGNAGNLGALDLMRAAGWLEEAIARGETDLDEGLEALGRQLAALTAASASWLDATDTAPPASAETPPLDPDRLQALRDDLRNNNLQALRRFEALKPALAGALGTAETGALDVAIHGLRFDEALAILDRAAARSGDSDATQEVIPWLQFHEY
ncbi:MAG: ATP-binding protein [Candidatus Competibacter sp.]|nr:ATP-binding protein [Candidatus Competibacter sp.]